MHYTVRHGDSLERIAAREMGDPHRWTELADYNMIRHHDRLLVGQNLFIPYDLRGRSHSQIGSHDYFLDAGPPPHPFERRTSLVPAWAHVFIIADEFNPFRRKLVRKVAQPTKPVTIEEFNRIMNPDKYGFDPIDPTTNVTVGRHVGDAMTNSRYTSASERLFGSPRFKGDRYWIDAVDAEASGVKIYEAEDLARDLDRVIKKTKNIGKVSKLEEIKRLSQVVDREVLLEGHIPASTIKGAGKMFTTRGLQVVEGVGFVLSIYDLGKAGQQSVRDKSFVPITKEGVRQSGGWAGGWAGAELGGMVGTAIGIETGPGALITGAIGSIIFGTAGFLGADWAFQRIGSKK